MYIGRLLGPILSNPLIIPSETENDKPNGFPRAIAFSPTLRLEESPKLK